MPIVRVEECTGCGTCVAACEAGAIRLAGRAVEIDAALCEECGACVAACPAGALVETAAAPATALAVARPSDAPVTVVSAPVYQRLAPLAGATLAFLGREVAPRLVDLLLATLERRLDAPVPAPGAAPRVSRGAVEPDGRGLRRRYRGGRVSSDSAHGRS